MQARAMCYSSCAVPTQAEHVEGAGETHGLLPSFPAARPLNTARLLPPCHPPAWRPSLAGPVPRRAPLLQAEHAAGRPARRAARAR